jgi:heme A synthase
MERYRPVFFYLIILTFILALCTVFMGAATTSTGSGMAFTEYLSSAGKWIFGYQWKDLIYGTQGFFEHHHRELGMVTGIFSVILWAFFRFKTKDRFLQKLMNLQVFFICLQGVMGMMTVKFALEKKTFSILHAIFGQLVVALLAVILVRASKSWIEGREKKEKVNFPCVSRLPLVLLIQLFLGAWYRHSGFAWIFFLHAFFALVVIFYCLFVIMCLSSNLDKNKSFKPMIWGLSLLLMVQLTLGIMSLIVRMEEKTLDFEKHSPVGANIVVQTSMKRSLPATAHVLVGTLMLALAAALRMQAHGQELKGSEE